MDPFSWPSISRKKRLEYSLFASGGSDISGINGVGSGGNDEGVAVEVEELLTMVAKMAVGAMVLHAGQFSRDNNQVTLGVVLSSLC